MIVIGVILSLFFVYKLHIGMYKTILDLVMFPLLFLCLLSIGMYKTNPNCFPLFVCFTLNI